MMPHPVAAIPQSPFFLIGYRCAITVALCCALTANFLFASGHDQQRCIELIALWGMAIVVLMRAGKGHIFPISKSTGMLLLTFLVLGLASVSTAAFLRPAVNEWSMLLLLVALVFAIASELITDIGRLPVFLQWIGIACGMYTVQLTIMYGAALATGFQMDMQTVVINFANSRHLNHAQTALLPLIVLLCVRTPRIDARRKLWFALAAFWWALLYVCEARASILALAVGSAAALMIRRGYAREFLTMMASTALAGVALYVLLFVFLPVAAGLQPIGSPSNVLARTAANPSSNRFDLWELTLQLIAAHPWLGVGPQHFSHESAKLYMGAHPHNWVLQIGSEWGIPALLCLLGTLLLGVRALLRSGRHIAKGDSNNQQMLATWYVACTAIFVDALLSGVIVMPQSQLAVALVLGMTCAWVRTQSGTEVEVAGHARSVTMRAIMAGLVAAGLCGSIWSVAPDMVRHARGDALTPAESAANPFMHWPRLWEAGYF
jgi:putative inorganic carbon (HCO3(-)) transporter